MARRGPRLALLFIAALLTAAPGPAGAAGERPRAVVELFTSQGCSSCPPADELMGALAAERDDLVVLTMPVTIWDYLGWTDTLARPELSDRQMDYSVARGDRAVYTPQAVVNGRRDVVGSDRGAILGSVSAQNADGPALPVRVALTGDADTLSIAVGPAPAGVDARNATVWLAAVEPLVEVPIRGGENRGRRIRYHNVVRAFQPVGMWRGKALAIDLPKYMAEVGDGMGAAVLVQAEGPEGLGPILGAAIVMPDDSGVLARK